MCCYELMPLVPFWTDDWDCRLIMIRLSRLIGLPYLSPEALCPGIVLLSCPVYCLAPYYCLTLCYCFALCIVSPRVLSCPVLLSHPVLLLRSVYCLTPCIVSPRITVSPCATASLHVLSRPVSLPRPDHFRYYIRPVLRFKKP